VRRRRVPDSIDGFRPPGRHFPLAARDVEQMPSAVEPPDLRAADDEGLIERAGDDGTLVDAHKGLSAVRADRAPDRYIERNGLASRPAAVVGKQPRTVRDHG